MSAISLSPVKIGKPNSNAPESTIDKIGFTSARIANDVGVFQKINSYFVRKLHPAINSSRDQDASETNPGREKSINKFAYILITFFFAGFGVNRFMRGQIAVGIVWLITGGIFGIGHIVDFIISLVKLSKYPGDSFTFTEQGDWTR